MDKTSDELCSRWNHMEPNQNLDPYKQIIAALLSDAQTLHSEVFSPRDAKLTIQKIESRMSREGINLLTQVFPRLGKAFDKALSGTTQLDCTGFQVKPGTNLPRFLGELFSRVFDQTGRILPTPCVDCIATIRTILFVFYKLELPYKRSEEQAVVDQFIKTEDEIQPFNTAFGKIADVVDRNPLGFEWIKPVETSKVIRRARVLLSRLFTKFDPWDISPRHGPGAVSTKEKLASKYIFRRINARIDAQYPFDRYYTASLGHICDSYKDIQCLAYTESPARVILVPKDSRGPRLISCEPLEFQWIQQGLGQAIVQHVERHPLTRYNVHFTDQGPNQRGAILGSLNGQYATLDLKEASDRVTIGLVRALFPQPLLDCLLSARSESTTLPSGKVVELSKFAPMGSALCFPVLALTVWAILAASIEDAGAREGLLIYGDDVIVPTAQAESAILTLESFGLKVNRDKSFIHGQFKESCGADAFAGRVVTPVRIRTRWSSHPSPDVYTSYIAYANSFYRRRFFQTSELITRWLCDIYKQIPQTDMGLPVPSLDEVPQEHRPTKTRVNTDYQIVQYRVRDVVTRTISKEIDGWCMLLRYFAEKRPTPLSAYGNNQGRCLIDGFNWNLGLIPLDPEPFKVRVYAPRGNTKFAFRWCGVGRSTSVSDVCDLMSIR